MLERIATILATLALFAERAACRSFPVRWLVLVILRRAEAVAAFLVEEETGREWPCAGEDADIGNAPADALMLAARLRMLAAFLSALSCRFGALPGRASVLADGATGRFAPLPVLLLVIPCRRRARPLDTS